MRDLDVVYVPVGMGSGICANIVVRDLLGLRTEIVGVVAEKAPAYSRSFTQGEVVSTETADTFVDGVACRTPDPVAVAMIRRGAARILEVSEDEAREAMAMTYRTTHNLPEPAGSLALAGLLGERDRVAGKTGRGGDDRRQLRLRPARRGGPAVQLTQEVTSRRARTRTSARQRRTSARRTRTSSGGGGGF